VALSIAFYCCCDARETCAYYDDIDTGRRAARKVRHNEVRSMVSIQADERAIVSFVVGVLISFPVDTVWGPLTGTPQAWPHMQPDCSSVGN